MLVVDAGSLYEVATHTPRGERISERLNDGGELAAPHVIDVEVLGVIRRNFLSGELDRTGAELAVDFLRQWPGERYGHLLLLERAWQLRANVRGWDAMYVALAEALQSALLTTDERLARVPGLFCRVEVVPR